MNRLYFIAALLGPALLLANGTAASHDSAPSHRSAYPEIITKWVDCSRYQTISAAIDGSDPRIPLLVRIKGTCTEFVSIERDNVTLEGNPYVGATIAGPDASSDVVSISGDGITLVNLTLAGGNFGVRNNHGVRIMIQNCVIQDTASNGIHVWVGDVRVQGSTIQRAGGDGLRILRTGSVAMSNSQVLDNTGNGIYAQQNAAISANGNTISRNQGHGVMLHSAAHGDFGSNDISDNRGNGLLIQMGSTANIDNNTITANDGDGVVAYLGATLVFHGNGITGNSGSGVVGNAHSTVQIGGAQIHGNGGDGIVMALGSKLILEEPKTEVFNNGNFGLWCGDDESSVNDPGLLDSQGNPAGPIACTGF